MNPAQPPLTRKSRVTSGLGWSSNRTETARDGIRQDSFLYESEEGRFGCVGITTLNVLGQGQSLNEQGTGSATLFLAEGRDTEQSALRWL